MPDTDRDLLLRVPARVSEDQGDLTWTVGTRHEHLIAVQTGAPYDRSARIRELGISPEQEREMRQQGAAQNLAIKADEEGCRARLRAEKEYPGE